MARELFNALKIKFKLVLAVFVFLISSGIYFAASPIYEGDFNKTGKSQNIRDNQILNDVLNYKPSFEGVVCVASPHCKFCIEAVKTKMNVLFHRNQIDVLVYLGFGDDKILGDFRVNTEAQEIPIVINSRPDLGLTIDEAVIPVFLFIRGGKIVHLWRNEQLGYPALDWMESKLQ
jgi:hypothetical protein